MVVPAAVAKAFGALINKDDPLTEGEKAEVRSMLEKHGSAFANYTCGHGIRPLWVCAQHCSDPWRCELARELVEQHGADVNFQCDNQHNLLNTLYNTSKRKGGRELTQYFLNRGTQIRQVRRHTIAAIENWLADDN